MEVDQREQQGPGQRPMAERERESRAREIRRVEGERIRLTRQSNGVREMRSSEEEEKTKEKKEDLVEASDASQPNKALIWRLQIRATFIYFIHSASVVQLQDHTRGGRRQANAVGINA